MDFEELLEAQGRLSPLTVNVAYGTYNANVPGGTFHQFNG